MTEYVLAVPCLLGFEGLIGDELKRLNMRDIRAETDSFAFLNDDLLLVYYQPQPA